MIITPETRVIPSFYIVGVRKGSDTEKKIISPCANLDALLIPISTPIVVQRSGKDEKTHSTLYQFIENSSGCMFQTCYDTEREENKSKMNWTIFVENKNDVKQIHCFYDGINTPDSDHVNRAIQGMYPDKQVATMNVIHQKKIYISIKDRDKETPIKTSCGPCGQDHDVDLCPLRSCEYCHQSGSHWIRLCPTKKRDDEKRQKDHEQSKIEWKKVNVVKICQKPSNGSSSSSSNNITKSDTSKTQESERKMNTCDDEEDEDYPYGSLRALKKLDNKISDDQRKQYANQHVRINWKDGIIHGVYENDDNRDTDYDMSILYFELGPDGHILVDVSSYRGPRRYKSVQEM
jgi:hypothetical protein